MTKNITSVRVKCPHCNAFLKDKEVLLDNKESIKMNIRTVDHSGHIWISSLHGSNNFTSSIDIKPSEIVTFSCTFCDKELTSQINCCKCNAPMANFHLSNGAVVNFCTRNNCNNNFIEFPDETDEEGNLIIDGQRARLSLKSLIDILSGKKIERDIKVDNRIYINCYCPKCLKSLTDNKTLSLKAVTSNNETGFLILSPYINDNMIKSTVNLKDDEILKDLICPYCDASLINQTKCTICHNQVATTYVPANSRILHYQICTKKGCMCHGLSDKDIFDIKASYEYISEIKHHTIDTVFK